MSLASALLKRLFVSKTLNIPWKEVKFARKRDPKHGKPCALLPDGTPAPIEFNVSHQAGLVALVGSKTSDVELGVDIVCVNERNDYRLIDTEGFDGWVDVYSEIFSPQESADMKYNTDPFKLLDGTEVVQEHLGRGARCVWKNQQLSATLPSGERRTFLSDLLIDAKLRRFYTFWCYKEAYIKLDGEALLATWIPELEFRNVRAPVAGIVPRCSTHGVWGERVGNAETWFQGKRLEDMKLEIQAFEEDFMIGVAAKPARLVPDILAAFESLNLQSDILEFVRSATSATS